MIAEIVNALSKDISFHWKEKKYPISALKKVRIGDLQKEELFELLEHGAVKSCLSKGWIRILVDGKDTQEDMKESPKKKGA